VLGSLCLTNSLFWGEKKVKKNASKGALGRLQIGKKEAGAEAGAFKRSSKENGFKKVGRKEVSFTH